MFSTDVKILVQTILMAKTVQKDVSAFMAIEQQRRDTATVQKGSRESIVIRVVLLQALDIVLYVVTVRKVKAFATHFQANAGWSLATNFT